MIIIKLSAELPTSSLSCHQQIFSGSVQLSLSLNFFSLLHNWRGIARFDQNHPSFSVFSSHLHIQDNHNNQRSISQLRHFGANLITAWHSLQEHLLASWNIFSQRSAAGAASAEIAVAGDRLLRGQNGVELVATTGTGRANLSLCCHLNLIPSTTPYPSPRYPQCPQTVLW